MTLTALLGGCGGKAKVGDGGGARQDAMSVADLWGAADGAATGDGAVSGDGKVTGDGAVRRDSRPRADARLYDFKVIPGKDMLTKACTGPTQCGSNATCNGNSQCECKNPWTNCTNDWTVGCKCGYTCVGGCAAQCEGTTCKCPKPPCPQ
ncbi:MAG: hypothetical protein IT371_05980 [Deltaproteobacteria bacterium]|nr:hypothetical protein [Deltaproteobacteria bacterium]